VQRAGSYAESFPYWPVRDLLRDWLGISTVIWLPEGIEDDETDGHVDEIACFVRPGVVLALVTSDTADGNYATLSENLARLKAARDAKGRPLEIVEIEQPARRMLADGRRASLSYINFYLANGGIIMPAFEDPQDKRAYDILHRVFADRQIVQVPASDIVQGGGGIHCITQQQPAGLPATPLPSPPEA